MMEKHECPICYKKIEWDPESKAEYINCIHCGYRLRTSNALPLLASTEIGDYKIIRLIGIGGMGEIYLAEQKSMLREVALKVLNKPLLDDNSYLARFYNEVRMLAKIEHPNIVSAIEAGYDNGICFFSMRYIRGDDIERLIKTKGYFTELEALKIIKDVALALEYVWNKYKLIHRDIKPANIMLTENGIVKLMDLGIAKSFKEDLRSDLTVEGIMVGSPFYISPEQASSRKDIDFHADIYSLGATLFHMITGKLPYDKPSSMEIIAAHLSDPVQDPRKYRKDISLATSNFTKKMMQKKPNDRFKSWESVINGIDNTVTKIKNNKSKGIVKHHISKHNKSNIKSKKKRKYLRNDIAKRKLKRSAIGRIIYKSPVKIFIIFFIFITIVISLIIFLINTKIKKQRTATIAYTQIHDYILKNKINNDNYKIALQKLEYLESFKIPEYIPLIKTMYNELEKKYKSNMINNEKDIIKKELQKLKTNVHYYTRRGLTEEAIVILEKYESNGKYAEEFKNYINSEKIKLQSNLMPEKYKENK